MSTRIAIIGAGMAGVQILYNYLKSDNKDLEIHLFDSRKQAGYGFPFVPDDKSLLLNQPQEKMSLNDEKKHYQKWLKENYPKEAEKRFTTRMRFGEYTYQFLGELLEDHRVSLSFKLVRNITIQDSRFELFFNDNTQETYDVVHLCFGQLPYSDPYKLRGIKGFYGNPYPLSAIKEELISTEKIGIIGTGLSSIDFFVFLKAYNYQGKIIFLSEDGRFPMIRGKELDMKLPILDTLFKQKKIGLTQLIRAILKQASSLNIDIEKLLPEKQKQPEKDLEFQINHLEESAILQYIILKYHDDFQEIFNQWTFEEQQYFHKKFGTKFQLIKSPMPLESAKKLLYDLQNGRAEVHMNIKSIEKKNNTFIATYPKGKVKMDCILNGTGPTFDLDFIAHKNNAFILIQQLLNNGILQKYGKNSFWIDFPSMSVISKSYGTLKNLKLHGQTVSGIHIANNDVGIIGMGAKSAVKDTLIRIQKGK